MPPGGIVDVVDELPRFETQEMASGEDFGLKRRRRYAEPARAPDNFMGRVGS